MTDTQEKTIRTHRACPLCAHETNTTIGTRNEFTLVACTACGFAYLLEDFVYTDFYTDFYYDNYHNPAALYDESTEKQGGFSYDESEELHKQIYSRALRAIARYIPLTGKRLLDVGCAEGSSLAVGKEYGMDVYGIDVSEYSIGVCHAKGHQNAFVSELVHVGEKISQVDIVTMIDVLEHIKDPHPNMKALRDIVAPLGVVYLDNNFFSLESFMHDPVYFNLKFEPPFHCSYFTEAQAIKLFAEYGFRLVYSRPKYIDQLFTLYRKSKALLNRDFRKKQKLIETTRLPNPYQGVLSSGSRLGQFVNRRYPPGLIFKKKV